MKKYIIKDTASGEIVHELNANVIGIELLCQQTCTICKKDFTTTDGRYHKCPTCRIGQTEFEITCGWCGRKFTTTDKRYKHCSYCIERNYECEHYKRVVK
jgi:hypothetical protein